MTERKWAMKKLGPGDYLLLSNDRTRVWRLAAYEETGTEEDGHYWALHSWVGRIDEEQAIAESIVEQDWTRWPVWASALRTRKEAVAAAMNYDDNRRGA